MTLQTLWVYVINTLAGVCTSYLTLRPDGTQVRSPVVETVTSIYRESTSGAFSESDSRTGHRLVSLPGAHSEMRHCTVRLSKEIWSLPHHVRSRFSFCEDAPKGCHVVGRTISSPLWQLSMDSDTVLNGNSKQINKLRVNWNRSV